jgi:hypothetical protein
VAGAARAGLVAVVMAGVCAFSLRAAPPELPSSAVGGDTYVVANMDVSKMTPDAVDAAAKAVLGQNFAMAQQGLQKYRDKYKEYADTGAEHVTFVASGDPTKGEKEPEPVVYVKLKPGTDHAAVEKKIREEQAKEGNAKADEMEFANQGDFLVMHKKGTALPSGGDAVKAKAFSEILGNSDSAFSVAFLPTDAIRTKMKDEMKADPNQPLSAIAPLLADSKWIKLDVQLGDSPKLGLNLMAADETSAKKMVDTAQQGAQQLKAQADQMKQAGPQFAGMAEALGGLADALKPTANGSKVALSVDGKTVGPIVSNFMPMIMGAGGAGGPGGGARPRPGGGL